MTPEEEKKKLESLLTALDTVNYKFIVFAKRLRLEEATFTSVEIMVMSFINRAMSLCDGFVTLIKANNFHAAGHLVRSHLDNYLRLSSLWLVDDREMLADAILEGTKMKKLKDRNGKWLSDTHLYESATDHLWMKALYDSTSGFVHFSNRHILTPNLKAEAGLRMGFHFSKKDVDVTDDYKIQGLEIMINITDALMGLLEKFCSEKEKKDDEESKSTLVRNFADITLEDMEEFTFTWNDKVFKTTSEYFFDEYQHRYRIVLPDGYYVLVRSWFKKPDGGYIWVQNVKPRERILDHSLVQVIGEGIEKALLK